MKGATRSEEGTNDWGVNWFVVSNKSSYELSTVNTALAGMDIKRGDPTQICVCKENESTGKKERWGQWWTDWRTDRQTLHCYLLTIYIYIISQFKWHSCFSRKAIFELCSSLLPRSNSPPPQLALLCCRSSNWMHGKSLSKSQPFFPFFPPCLALRVLCNFCFRIELTWFPSSISQLVSARHSK